MSYDDYDSFRRISPWRPTSFIASASYPSSSPPPPPPLLCSVRCYSARHVSACSAAFMDLDGREFIPFSLVDAQLGEIRLCFVFSSCEVGSARLGLECSGDDCIIVSPRFFATWKDRALFSLYPSIFLDEMGLAPSLVSNLALEKITSNIAQLHALLCRSGF